MPYRDYGLDMLETRRALVRAEMYLAQYPQAECPTLGQLVSGGILSSSTRTADPWERKFRISCDGEDVTVESAGPDRQWGTMDDIK